MHLLAQQKQANHERCVEQHQRRETKDLFKPHLNKNYENIKKRIDNDRMIGEDREQYVY